MTIKELKPRKALNKAFLKVKPNRIEIEVFKTNLIQLLDKISVVENLPKDESEEHLKNDIRDFLRDTYYKENYAINTKDKKDLVIYLGKDTNRSAGVIIEAKRPSNKSEMINSENLNKKAFQELVLYYLRERITHKNLDVKHLVVTNINEWFIFDEHLFERLFAQNKTFVKQFENFESSKKKTEVFYKEIAEPFIANITSEIEFTYFNIQDFQKPLRNKDKEDDKELIALFKLLSPEHLLKLPFTNDSNSLDKRFYSELLHIIGLTETKEGSKKLIERNKVGERFTGTILEDTIIEMDSINMLSQMNRPAQYGTTQEDRLFNIALELCITWINRILFLKLLEAQLITYHRGDTSYTFLHLDKIKNYDDLNRLFFQVLAQQYDKRNEDVKKTFEKVPYLNSSLFEPTELEYKVFTIKSLNDKSIPIFAQTVLKDQQGKKRTGQLSTLQYLFEFLDAYDFGAEGGEDIQEDNKTLINASVLGLIFEKINGYKDGSIFTPGFITMYMSKETIRRAVIQKFNETKGWKCKSFEELKEDLQQEIKAGNRKEVRKEANIIVNSLKIIDPAVGSGHFLVSVLNELIAIKSELNILIDSQLEPLNKYTVEVVNDELIITDDEGIFFHYNPNNKESQRVQETLFHEKQTLIENCLFGVDINPNSVKICRLRLWIELLKNAYYKNATELETLPNIDINIKCGNSLVSRFALDADIKQALKKSKWTIDSYRLAVQTYRNAQNKEQKREMERLIADIKSDFKSNIDHPFKKKISAARGKIDNIATAINTQKQWGENIDKKLIKDLEKATEAFQKLEDEKEEIENNQIYENAFEWRFEFPEVLNDEGDFVGFDVVIGNPPYIRQEEFSDLKPYLKNRFEVFHSLADLLTYFVELSHNILKQNGVFQFIISGKFTRAGYGSLIRKFLSEKTELTHFIDFAGKPIFDEATVDAAIVGFIKKEVDKKAKMIFKEVLKEDNVSLDFATYINTNATLYPTDSLSEVVWSFDNPKWHSIIEKIANNGVPLSDWDITINFGIKTGYNEAFIIDEAKGNELIQADPKSAELIKPLLRGRDIQKYVADDVMNWVICTFPSKKIDIDKYLVVKSYLETFGKTIHQTGEKGSRKRTSHKWYETQDNIAFWEDFQKPKLVWKRIGSILRFCYDESGAYCLDSTCIATGDKVKFLSAVLNSKLCNKELFRLSPKTGTGDLIISVQALNPLRVPIPNERQEIEICDLLDKILENKKENPTAENITLEKQIDQLVYQLYGLTEEEIKIVEGI